MITKKVSLLVLVFMLITNVCLATNWVWVSSNDKMNVYFDSDTCEINNGVLSFWEKDINPEGYYLITYEEYSNEKLMLYDYVLYNTDGSVIKKGNYHDYIRIVPDSNGEYLVKTVASYCK